MQYDTINKLVCQGFSSHKIAEILNCSQTNVRHWLKKFNLKTNPNRLLKNQNKRICPSCKQDKPLSDFFKRRQKEGASVYCKSCTSEQTIKRQQTLKQKCVDYKGGKCQSCGYKKYLGALEFHHLEPSKKDFSISKNKCRSFEELKFELDKCALVCANCHREIHGGLKMVALEGLEPTA